MRIGKITGPVLLFIRIRHSAYRVSRKILRELNQSLTLKRCAYLVFVAAPLPCVSRTRCAHASFALGLPLYLTWNEVKYDTSMTMFDVCIPIVFHREISRIHVGQIKY